MGTAAGVGYSCQRNPRLAGREAARSALARGGFDAPDFVVLAATTGYDQQVLLDSVREATARAPLTGCSCEGVIVDDRLDESNYAVAVLAIKSDKISFSHGLVGGLQGNSYGVGREIGDAARPHGDAGVLMMLPDGLTANFDQLLAGLGASVEAGRTLPVIGGAAADNDRFAMTFQYRDDEVVSDSVAWTLLHGDVRVAWGVDHGCEPLGTGHVVTRAKGREIYEVDDLPALDVLRQYAPPDDDPGLPNRGRGELRTLEIGFEAPPDLDGYDRYLVRVVLAQDEETKSVTLPVEAATGTRLRLMHRDFDRVVAGAGRLADRLGTALSGREPELVLHFECAGRGRVFLNEQLKGKLIQTLRSGFPAAPWFGLYVYGELGPVARRNYFHNCTSVVAALY